MKLETKALHAGEGNRKEGQPLSPPIVNSVNFYADPEGVGYSALDMEEDAPHFYTRWGSPTVAALEERLAALEGGKQAIAFASGMAAAAAIFFHELSAGDHLIISDLCYPGVAELALDLAERYGIRVTGVDTSDLEAVARAITPATKLIHIETPANPIWRVSDIGQLATIAHNAGALLSVDSTVATPVGTRPLELGADYVMHSLTKYATGHGDVLAGAVIARDKDLFALRQRSLSHLGAVLSPTAASQILRSIETLPLRMAAHQANADKIARFLEAHPAVTRVWWPGLASHPQHEVAAKQMENFSGMLSFTTAEPRKMARQIADRIEIVSYAVSLGKTKTLIFYIDTETLISAAYRWAEDRAESFRDETGQGVFRLSVGLEHADDIIADLDRALSSG